MKIRTTQINGATSAGESLLTAADSAAQRSALDLVVGSDVQAYNVNLSYLAGLTAATDKLSYFSSGSAMALTDFSSAARTLIAQTSQSAMRSTGLGLGSAATLTAGTAANNVVQLDGDGKLPAVDGSNLINLPGGSGALLAANNLSDLANAGTARGNLGVAIGTNVQAYNANLGYFSGLTAATDKLAYFSSDSSMTTTDFTGIARTFLAQTTQADMRGTGLGLGSAAVLDHGTSNGNLVRLDPTTGKLPAVDGSLLTNLPAAVGALLAANNLSDLANAGTARGNLGVAIGTNVQAYSAKLTAIDGLTWANDTASYHTGTNTAGTYTLTSTGRTLVGQASQSATMTAGLGFSANAVSLVQAADYSAMKTLLSLTVGTDVQAYSAKLGVLAGQTWANDTATYYTGTNTAGTYNITASARTLLGQTSQSTMLTAGLGLSANGVSLVQSTDYATMRAVLGLVIGTDVQAYNAKLAAISGVTAAADKLFYFTGPSTGALADLTSKAREILAATTGAAMMIAMLGAASAGQVPTADGSGGVAWGTPGGTVQIGDVIETARTLTLAGGYAPANGASYLKSSYPTAGGLLPGTPVLSGWTSQTSQLGSENALWSGVVNGVGFVVAANGKVSTTTDGQTWTARNVGFGISVVRRVIYLSGCYIALGENGKISVSTDLATWTVTQAGSAFSGDTYVTAASNGSIGIAINANGVVIRIDAVTATTTTLSSPAGGLTNIVDVAWGNNTWVAVGSAGKLVTGTANGTTWTDQTAINAGLTPKAVRYAGGLWVVAGSAIYTSANLTTWTSRSTSFGVTTINALYHDGSKWLAAGDSGKVASSADGITWAQMVNTGLSTNNLTGIIPIASRMAVVGASGFAASSNYTASTTEFTVPTIAARAAGFNVYVRIA